MRLLERLSVSAACLSLAVMSAAPALASSSAGCTGFNGEWQTVWGSSTTHLRISGTSGAYSYQGGTLSGEIKGDAYWGIYQESGGGTGRFHFDLSSDGNSFTGWFAPSSNPDAKQAWKGVCLGP
jgi:hypothetical protein